MSGPGGWRVAAVRALQKLPPGPRRALWSARRRRLRAKRRAAEGRGDYSLSSPALHDMDAKLARHLDFDGGFFVEAGANDGYDQSNTYRLERVRGWRGVLVEPVPHLHREAVRERPGSRVFDCALVPAGHAESHVTMRYGGLMTTVAGLRGSPKGDREWVQAAHEVAQEEPEHEFTAPARTLSSLLDEVSAPEIDFLSLDVEGFEPQVLAGLDLERHAPRWVLVEIREGGSPREAVEAALGERYEAVEELSPFDVLYRRSG